MGTDSNYKFLILIRVKKLSEFFWSLSWPPVTSGLTCIDSFNDYYVNIQNKFILILLKFRGNFFGHFYNFNHFRYNRKCMFLCILVNIRSFKHRFIIKFQAEFFDEFSKSGNFRYYR